MTAVTKKPAVCFTCKVAQRAILSVPNFVPSPFIIIIIDKTDAGLNGLCIRDITLICDVIRDGFEASRFKAKAKAMGLRGQGQGHGTSRPRPRPWVIIKVEAKDGREQSVVTMT